MDYETKERRRMFEGVQGNEKGKGEESARSVERHHVRITSLEAKRTPSKGVFRGYPPRRSSGQRIGIEVMGKESDNDKVEEELRTRLSPSKNDRFFQHLS